MWRLAEWRFVACIRSTLYAIVLASSQPPERDGASFALSGYRQLTLRRSVVVSQVNTARVPHNRLPLAHPGDGRRAAVAKHTARQRTVRRERDFVVHARGLAVELEVVAPLRRRPLERASKL